MTPANLTEPKGWPLPGWTPAPRVKRKCGNGDRGAHLAVESGSTSRLYHDGVVVATGTWLALNPNRGGKLRRREFRAAVARAFRVAVV